jgi:tetratricopeptide (TPR) repeat protein
VFYQKGLEHLWRWETEPAADDFAHAVALDSTFALAHLEWAVATTGNDLLLANPLFDVSSIRSSMGRAKANSVKATVKEREFIDAYAALFDRDYQGADTLARALVDHYPNDKETNYLLSWTSWFTAKYDDMIRASERTLEIDPTFALGYNSLAYAYSYVNDYDKAVSAIKKLMALSNADPWYDSAVEIFISAGRFDDAYKLCGEKLTKEPKIGVCICIRVTSSCFRGMEKKRNSESASYHRWKCPWGLQNKRSWPGYISMREGIGRRSSHSGRRSQLHITQKTLAEKYEPGLTSGCF